MTTKFLKRQTNSPADCQTILPAYRRNAELARTTIDLALGLLWLWTLGADLARWQAPLLCQSVTLALFAVYGVVCAVLGLDLFWQIWGRERLIITTGRMSLSHEIGFLHLVRQIPLNAATGISTDIPVKRQPLTRKVLRFFDFSLGKIAITAPEQVYHLGAGLKNAEVEHTAQILQERFAVEYQETQTTPQPATRNPIPRWRYTLNLFLFANLVLSLALIALTPFLSWLYLHPSAYLPVDLNASDAPSDYGAPYQDVTLTTSDNINLSAWYTPPQNGSVIILAQGYQDTRLTKLHARFARHGYGVISFDYRAHGKSGGELCSLGYHEALDVIAALDFAHAQPGAQHVGAWGYSMGAATVIRAAMLRPDLEAIAVDSSFATLEDLLNTEIIVPFMRPWFRRATEWQTGLRTEMGRPIDQIGLISPRPVFIMGGGSDWTVLPYTAQRLYDAAGEPRSLWLEPEAGHLGACRTNLDRCEQKMINFFDSAFR